MSKILFTSRVTGSLEEASGTDKRLSVSSRQDSRSYYNSRDKSQCFSLVWDDATSAVGDFVLYWKNTDTTGKELVIDSVGLNSEFSGAFTLEVVTGTPSGQVVAPFCMNTSRPKTAQALAVEAAGTAITGLTSVGVVDHAGTKAEGHEEFRLDDRLRIGQDQAVAIKYSQGATGRTWGVVFGFYE